MIELTEDQRAILQEKFNQAVKGLAAQGFQRSRDASDTMCTYRAPDGKRCAAGHCMSDDKYRTRFEGLSISYYAPDEGAATVMEAKQKALAAAVGLPYEQWAVDFMSNLQRAHDNADGPGEMRERLGRVGDSYGLVRPKELLDAPR